MRNIILTLAILFTLSTSAETNNLDDMSLEEISQTLLTNIKNGKSTDKLEEQLKNIPMKRIISELETDKQKIAFWVNIYNAFIQIKLNSDPKLYENRGKFFGMKQIAIGGKILSFEKIEHGIIRRSQKPAGLGYVKKLFPGRLERKLRVDARDYRVHFALNCGAKSCPPVGIYSSAKLDAEFNYMTQKYLKANTTYNDETNTVKSTTLFSWFRGDFDGLDGAKDILVAQKIISSADVKLEFNDYDWTLLTNQFVDIKL
jgi:hypothetical protein